MWIDPLSLRMLRMAGIASINEGKGPVVLMYHSVSPGGKFPTNRWAVSEKRFREQLGLLDSEGWTTVCVRDLFEINELPPRSIVITFDDGYADNYEHGFKVLLDYGMRATWFIVSRDIGGLSGWKDDNGMPQPMLDASQLRHMAATGMEIGAHTRTHARLPDLDEKRMLDEVKGSKMDLEDLLGLPVSSFAYPYGLYDDRSIASVRESGFRTACTTNTGRAFDDDNFQMRRVAVFSHDTLSRFARKLLVADTEVRWRRVFPSVLHMGFA